MVTMPDEFHAQVQGSSTAGNGLFATKDIPAGGLIFRKTRPLIGVLDIGHLADTCSNCFVWTQDHSLLEPTDVPKEVKACTGCQVLRYCSKKCQSQSWKRHHKHECSVLTKAPTPHLLPQAVRATMQITRMRESGVMAEDDWEGLVKLDSHYETVESMGGERFETLQTFGMGAWQYSTPTPRSFSILDSQKMFARVLVNALTLVSPSFDPMGICIDPIASVANHSCDPNAVAVMDHPGLSFRALRSIKKGEEVFISYIDSTEWFAMRQKLLKAKYHFTCRCSKCEHGPTLREDQFAIRPKDLSKKWKRFADDHVKESPELGNEEGCYVGPTPDDRRASILLALAWDEIKQAQAYAFTPISLSAKIEKLEMGMRLHYQSKLFAITRQPWPQFRHELMVAKLSTSNMQDAAIAWMQAVKTYFLIDPVLYPQSFHPVRVVHVWTLALLTLYIVSDADSHPAFKGLVESCPSLPHVVYGLLREVAENVGKSHGEGTKFAKVVTDKFEQMKMDTFGGDAMLERVMRDHLKDVWVGFRTVADWMEY
ncbi:SET domain-containing protein [Aulographum hederae CBS 113979]|uniref:SET domain-containing protein n=1 Tax=Aulographum hederae CBS 113979 TaxID=1176131 RepID=A0A6G1GZL7_9PEZI|nr:SET domain-containing protein [Aulographum hederae CBS 113979]